MWIPIRKHYPGGRSHKRARLFGVYIRALNFGETPKSFTSVWGAVRVPTRIGQGDGRRLDAATKGNILNPGSAYEVFPTGECWLWLMWILPRDSHQDEAERYGVPNQVFASPELVCRPDPASKRATLISFVMRDTHVPFGYGCGILVQNSVVAEEPFRLRTLRCDEDKGHACLAIRQVQFWRHFRYRHSDTLRIHPSKLLRHAVNYKAVVVLWLQISTRTKWWFTLHRSLRSTPAGLRRNQAHVEAVLNETIETPYDELGMHQKQGTEAGFYQSRDGIALPYRFVCFAVLCRCSCSWCQKPHSEDMFVRARDRPLDSLFSETPSSARAGFWQSCPCLEPAVTGLESQGTAGCCRSSGV